MCQTYFLKLSNFRCRKSGSRSSSVILTLQEGLPEQLGVFQVGSNGERNQSWCMPRVQLCPFGFPRHTAGDPVPCQVTPYGAFAAMDALGNAQRADTSPPLIQFCLAGDGTKAVKHLVLAQPPVSLPPAIPHSDKDISTSCKYDHSSPLPKAHRKQQSGLKLS